jgi:uncharacterized membrane protein
MKLRDTMELILLAALLLLPLAAWRWRAHPPSPGVWLSMIALGVACTGLGYILYFRLIANVGPTRAIAVTFLIPAFGMLFGVLFLGEAVTAAMLAGCAVILIGTALATGLLKPEAVRSRALRRPASTRGTDQDRWTRDPDALTAATRGSRRCGLRRPPPRDAPGTPIAARDGAGPHWPAPPPGGARGTPGCAA